MAFASSTSSTRTASSKSGPTGTTNDVAIQVGTTCRRFETMANRQSWI